MVADYRGLTMPEIDELRSKLLEAGARFTVVKNTLTRLAAEAAGKQEVLELIDGPTAIAFLDSEGDPAAVAKVLNDTARTNDVLVIRGGLLEGTVVGDVEIKRLATLPSAEVLRAQLVGAVAGAADDRGRPVRGAAARPGRRDRRPHPPARGAGRDRPRAGGRRRAEAAGRGAAAEEPAAEEPAAEEEQSEEPSAEAEVASADEEEEQQDG